MKIDFFKRLRRICGTRGSTAAEPSWLPCARGAKNALRHIGAQNFHAVLISCSNGAQEKSSVLILSTELFTELSPYYFPQTFALRSAFTKTGASKIETTTAKTALIPEVISFVLHESAAAFASLPLSISVINDLPMESTM